MREFGYMVPNNILATSGLNLQINGSKFNVKGMVLYGICDTPAAALLGGFKESSLAKKPCRKCYGELLEMSKKFDSQDFTQRNMTSHLKECSAIENPHISKANKAFWSKFYGINGLSPLAQVKDFALTSNLVMDPMHIICEGIACNIVALSFHMCIIEYYFFTLDWLNGKIQNYPYTKGDKGHIP